jgi:acyl carrier protein
MFGRTRTALIEGQLTHDKLRAWLVAELARMVKITEAEVDTGEPFETYGLHSLAAVQFSGALEKVVEHRLSPGILFDHPTIDDLVDYLTRELPLAADLSSSAGRPGDGVS